MCCVLGWRGYLSLERHEKVVPPNHERELVDLVDVLPPLLAGPGHPVPVEVCEQIVQHLGRESVPASAKNVVAKSGVGT